MYRYALFKSAVLVEDEAGRQKAWELSTITNL